MVGRLDVESAERDAFTEADRQALEGCAAALRACLPSQVIAIAAAKWAVIVGGEGSHPSGSGSTLGDQATDDHDHSLVSQQTRAA